MGAAAVCKQSLVAFALSTFAVAANPEPRLPALSTIAQPAAALSQATGATVLVVVAVRGREVTIQTFVETSPGSRRKPDANSLIRLCSLTKVFTTDVLVQLAADQKLGLDDPLQKFAPAGARVPIRKTHGAASSEASRELENQRKLNPPATSGWEANFRNLELTTIFPCRSTMTR